MSTEDTSVNTLHASFSNLLSIERQQTELDELQKFTGKPDQNISKFINAIEHVGSSMNLDDSTLHILATIKLGGTAWNWYDHNKETLTTWQLLKKHLLERFQPSISSVKRKLKTRTQQPNEPLQSYYDDIIDLCKQVEPQMPIHMIVDYLQDGVRQDLQIDIRRQLINLKTEITPALFLKIGLFEEKLQNELSLSSTVCTNQSTTKSTYPLRHYLSTAFTPSTTTRSSSRSTSMAQSRYHPCFICHRTNHRTVDCYYKRANGCFRCGNPNHVIRNCPKRFH